MIKHLQFGLRSENLPLPTRHSEAKSIGAPKYNTGKPCKHGHYSDRYTADGHCVECRLIDGASRRQTSQWQDWKNAYEKTDEAILLRSQRNARYNAKPEKSAAAKITKKEWQRKNRARLRMYRANRLARIKQATPSWVNMREILEIYIESDRISQETGIAHEVDHFYPLHGRNSCGLHVPWNLRIIPRSHNRKKYNKMPEEIQALRIEVREFLSPTNGVFPTVRPNSNSIMDT
jgi:hypothetical protein